MLEWESKQSADNCKQTAELPSSTDVKKTYFVHNKCGHFQPYLQSKGEIFCKQTADKYVNKYQLTFKQVCEKKLFVEDMRPLNFLTTLPIIKKSLIIL